MGEGVGLCTCLLTTAKIMQCFALRLRVMVVGKIPPVRLESGGNNAFAIDESRTSKVSGGLVNFLVY